MSDPTLPTRLRALSNGHQAEPIGRLASAIAPETVEWIWPGRLAVGKLTTCDGDPGLGKSTLTCEVAARITRGEALPGSIERAPRGAVLLSAEDGPADTIRPRLELAGADLDRVYIMEGVRHADGSEGSVTLGRSLAEIEEAVVTHDAGLLVVDPVMAYLGADVSSHRDQDVRTVLAPLVAMLDRTRCACVLLRHLNKTQTSTALYRGGGSIGIVGAARFGWLVARDPDDESARIVTPLKCNIGPEPPGLRFRLASVPGSDHARVEWDTAPVTIKADGLLAAGASDEDKSAVEEATDWLRDRLNLGACPAAWALRDARKDGISEKTLRRAKRTLGVRSRRLSAGASGEGEWIWELPILTDWGPE